MLWTYLNDELSAAFAAAGYAGVKAVVEQSRSPDVGQFQCTTALTLAKTARRAPRAIVEDVVAQLQTDIFARPSVDGPGFINFSLEDAFLTSRTATAIGDERQGCAPADPRKLVLDFGGPNVAKRMHVGHLRSMVIGDALQRCCRFLGHNVTSDIHLGDWGLPMGMLLAALSEQHGGLERLATHADLDGAIGDAITDDSLSALYPQAAARCRTDPGMLERAKQETALLQSGDPVRRAVWRRMVDASVQAARSTTELMGVHFDEWNGESNVNDRLLPMLERLTADGVAERSQGALVIEVARSDDNEPVPPLMLVKGDGSATYAATDLATVEQRVQQHDPDEIWYVVDQRQRLHFVQLFRAAERAAMDGPVFDHIGFGTVNGPDGKPFKTRAGDTMGLRDLLEMTIDEARIRVGELRLADDFDTSEREQIATRVGLAAIKYADLRNHRQSDYIFDVAQFSSFEGRTGPYLCYSTVRARSILSKATSQGLEPGDLLTPASNAERDLYLRLLDFGRAVRTTYEKRAPNVLCEHAYDLAQNFNSFYHETHILSESDQARQASQLRLTRGVADQLTLTLSLLGIETPRRM